VQAVSALRVGAPALRPGAWAPAAPAEPPAAVPASSGRPPAAPHSARREWRRRREPVLGPPEDATRATGSARARAGRTIDLPWPTRRTSVCEQSTELALFRAGTALLVQGPDTQSFRTGNPLVKLFVPFVGTRTPLGGENGPRRALDESRSPGRKHLQKSRKPLPPERLSRTRRADRGQEQCHARRLRVRTAGGAELPWQQARPEVCPNGHP
jgi:hypothetical protein